MPLDSLPVSYICNFDQSQKSVEPIANRTPKETGECVVKTGGKEKEWIIFFCPLSPTSRKVLCTFGKFCPVGVQVAQTIVYLPTFQFRPGKEVFWGGVGGVLCKYEREMWRLSKDQGLGVVFWAKWDPIWAKWDPIWAICTKIGQKCSRIGEKKFNHREGQGDDSSLCFMGRHNKEAAAPDELISQRKSAVLMVQGKSRHRMSEIGSAIGSGKGGGGGLISRWEGGMNQENR